MRRVLWLIGNHLSTTRTRLVAARYGDVPRAVRALLEHNAAALSVASPLHKIPHYLENRLTLDDAHRTLAALEREGDRTEDRKSTRLNSSHANISYAVFCLKKKKNIYTFFL